MEITVVIISVLLLFIGTSSRPVARSSTNPIAVDPVKYLRDFGWLEKPANIQKSNIDFESPEIKSAIKKFQAFAGLKESGYFDNATISVINLPRCGETDMDEIAIDTLNTSESVSHKRSKRFALQGTRWKLRHLTYNISKYSQSEGISNQDVDIIIDSAFKQWENVANLTFTRARHGKVHIDIRFEVLHHGDDDPFDGPGGTTAHAYFPVYGGDIHFDDSEKWTIKAEWGVNLFQVATHEIGHALGLEHSDVQESVMAPFYRTYRNDFKIHADDMEAIQTLYGKKVLTICDTPRIDAATTMMDGFTYLFSGPHVYRLTKEGKIDEGYPKAIAVEFENLNLKSIDAAITRSNGITYIFKGDEFWRLSNTTVDIGFPKKVSESFPGVPTPLDAALVFSKDLNIYFFKGNQYWKFDHTQTPPVATPEYPKPITDWRGIPNNLDAAARLIDTYGNEFTYFFKEDRFWRFNDQSFSVFLSDPPYPKLISTSLFGCRIQS